MFIRIYFSNNALFSHYLFFNILQRLRCKCNFHALKFVPKIQQVGSLLVTRIRKYDATRSLLDKQLLGKFMPSIPLKQHDMSRGPSKYLALHLRFEMDMVAYSLCDFGGGENEREELQGYREIHFPTLVARMKDTEYVYLVLVTCKNVLLLFGPPVVSSMRNHDILSSVIHCVMQR